MNVQNAPRDAANAPICIDLGAWGVPYVHYTNVLARRIVPLRDDVRFPDFFGGPAPHIFCATKEPNNQTQVATQPSAGVTGELEVNCFMHPESVTPERTSAISNY